MMLRTLLAVWALLLAACTTTNQPVHSDITLDSGRPLTEGLASYDVLHYTLRHQILIDDKAISGAAMIRFRARRDMSVLELDFDGAYDIDFVEDAGGRLDYSRDEAKLHVDLGSALTAGDTREVTVYYSGQPLEAKRAPWDGGFVWAQTPSGKPWIATAMQGEGCDIWWPCKDHPDGEPESMDLYFTVPKGLVATANGVLQSVTPASGHGGEEQVIYHWRTEVPTNTYGVALNVAPYVLIEDEYTSSNGTVVPVKFWAIEDHEEEARLLFEQEFAATIEFFERKVGPYPWGQEKLGVTETPHLGMEHQTINAYGNEFRRGKYGFDWLFHHELAHEWFGNVMTHRTVSDMWLHEGFGAFMQPEYTREVLGDAAFHARMYDMYMGIKACNPIAPREEFSADQLYFDDPEGQGPAGDIYSKGTWLLHSLRYVIGEDAFWRAVRRLVYDTAAPHTLRPPIRARLRTTDEFMAFASDEAGQDLAWFFEVYARRGPLPRLQVRPMNLGVELKWTDVGELEFPMPVPVRVNGEMQRVEFTGNRALVQGVREQDIQVDPYMQVLRKLPIVPTCDERRDGEETPTR